MSYTFQEEENLVCETLDDHDDVPATITKGRFAENPSKHLDRDFSPDSFQVTPRNTSIFL